MSSPIESPPPRNLSTWPQLLLGVVLAFFTFMAGFVMAIRGYAFCAYLAGGVLAGILGPWTVLGGLAAFLGSSIPGMGFPVLVWILGGIFGWLLRRKLSALVVMATLGAFLLVGKYADGALLHDEQEISVAGTEAIDLMEQASGTIMLDEPVGGLFAIRLPGLGESFPRIPDTGQSIVHSIGGPVASGRVALIEESSNPDRYALRILELASGEYSTVFEAKGKPRRDDAAGDYLALDPLGEQVAFVAHASGVQLHAPKAYLMEGSMEVWNIEGRNRTHSHSRVLDDTLAWFPDGKRIAYVALTEPSEAERLRRKHVEPGDNFGVRTRAWARVPVVHVLNIETGESVAVHRGERPILSPDGHTLLVRDFELNWRVFNIMSGQSRRFIAPGALYPGAIAFVAPEIVLYWARATEGAPSVYAEHSGPWGGKRRLQTLKIVDLRDGRFQTVVPAIDQRRDVSFGAVW